MPRLDEVTIQLDAEELRARGAGGIAYPFRRAERLERTAGRVPCLWARRHGAHSHQKTIEDETT